MNLVSKIFHWYSYLEWIAVIGFLYLSYFVWFDWNPINHQGDVPVWLGKIILGFFIPVICILFMKFELHEEHKFKIDNILKCKCSFYVHSFTIESTPYYINGTTYYMPIITILTKWGYFYKFIIGNDLNIDKTPSGILEEIKTEPSYAMSYQDKYYYKTEAEACYNIKRFKEKLQELKEKEAKEKQVIKENKPKKVEFKTKKTKKLIFK